MFEDVHEALENSATSRKKPSILSANLPTKQDILNWRDRLTRFLEEVDSDYTVSDLLTALEDYTYNQLD